MTRMEALLALDAACLVAQNDPDPEIRAAVELLGERLDEVIGDAFPDYGAMLDAQKESVQALSESPVVFGMAWTKRGVSKHCRRVRWCLGTRKSPQGHLGGE